MCQELTNKQETQGNKQRPMPTKGSVWTELVWGNEGLTLSKTLTHTHTHSSHCSVGLVPFPNQASGSQCRCLERQHLPLSDAVSVIRNMPSSTREGCHLILRSPGSITHSRTHTAVYSMNQIIFSTFSVLLLPFLVISKKKLKCSVASGVPYPIIRTGR